MRIYLVPCVVSVLSLVVACSAPSIVAGNVQLIAWESQANGQTEAETTLAGELTESTTSVAATAPRSSSTGSAAGASGSGEATAGGGSGSGGGGGQPGEQNSPRSSSDGESSPSSSPEGGDGLPNGANDAPQDGDQGSEPPSNSPPAGDSSAGDGSIGSGSMDEGVLDEDSMDEGPASSDPGQPSPADNLPTDPDDVAGEVYHGDNDPPASVPVPIGSFLPSPPAENPPEDLDVYSPIAMPAAPDVTPLSASNDGLSIASAPEPGTFLIVGICFLVALAVIRHRNDVVA